MYDRLLQQDNYYRLSGKISWGLTLSVFIGALLILFVAAFAAFWVESVRSNYKNYKNYGYLFEIALVVLTGALSANINQLGDNRNRVVGVFLCLLLGVAATWFFWGFWCFRTWHILHHATAPGFWHCFRFSAILDSVMAENPDFRSIYLTIIRSVEALMFLIAAIFGMCLNFIHASYCESCRMWTSELFCASKRVLKNPEESANLRRNLEAKDFSALTNTFPGVGYDNRLDVSVHGCSCRETICMTVKQNHGKSCGIPHSSVIVRDLRLDKSTYLYLKPKLYR